VALVDPRIFSVFQSSGDHCRDASGMRSRPERIVLGVADGVEPSPKPPVRIFLGTEPAQYRAERIFVYSIEKVRDPARVYEIHLMKELAGFDRRLWLTGFTNYRYAIPHYAGGAGKAIWNDVDEIYLSDPALLFDLDMQGHGILTVPKLAGGSTPDSSVMLIDCELMAPLWGLEDVQHKSARKLLDRVLSVPGLCGPLAPEWNARDAQYVEGRSYLIHYTALHTQPWQPLPGRYVYQGNPVGEVWYDLERKADAEGYAVFTERRPSAAYRALRQRVLEACEREGTRRAPSEKASDVANVRELVTLSDATTLLDVGFAAPVASPDEMKGVAERSGVSSAYRLDFCSAEASLASPGGFDGVICTEVLEYLPDENIEWFVEALFARAKGFLYATVSDGSHAPKLPDGTPAKRLASGGRERWATCFENASARHPDVHWRLVFDRTTGRGHRVRHLREGGRRLAGDPVVWVLNDDDPVTSRASRALAASLGWPAETKSVDSATEGPPWPDLVIAAGRRPLRVARSIAQRSLGRSRVVEIRTRGGRSARPFDLVVTHGHFDLPRDRRRIETLLPLNDVTPDRIEQAADRAPAELVDAPRPRVLLLVGPSTESHGLEPITASKLAEEAQRYAMEAGGTLFVITSTEADGAVERSIRNVVGGEHCASASAGSDGHEKVLEYLAHADSTIVTGHSPCLIADAAASGRPLAIQPVPARTLSRGARIARWIDSRARAHPANRRGTPRPQKHFEYLCARLIERGIVEPPPDLDALHRALLERGVAQRLADIDPGQTPRPAKPLREADEVARRIRSMLADGSPSRARTSA
jgi:mitochondrial fission protein ELM1